MPFHARLDGGHARTGEGHPTDPDVVVTTDLDSFIGLLSQRLSTSQAVATGRVQVEGDEAALERFVEIFAWPLPAAVRTG